MTIQELIEKLQKSSDPSQDVTIKTTDEFYCELVSVHINDDGSVVIDEGDEII